MARQKSRRKNFLINPEFQFSFILSILAASLLVCGIFYASQYVFFLKLLNAGKEIGLPSSHVFFKFVIDQQNTMTQFFLGASVLSSAVLFGWGLIYSHRIAGPLYRLKQFLRNKREHKKEAHSLSFRDKDYFKDLTHEVNDLVHAIERAPQDFKKSA